MVSSTYTYSASAWDDLLTGYNGTIASKSNSVLHDSYHNFPWEYDADVRGVVSRMHADWAPEISERYFSSIKNR